MSDLLSKRVIIRQGLQLLLDEQQYTQKDIHDKLAMLDHRLSKSSISNLCTEKEKISAQLIKKAARGIQELIKIECCLTFDTQEQKFVAVHGCKPREVIPHQKLEKPTTPSSPPYLIHDGRRDVPQKIQFYQQAQTEVIEIGIRLRNFKNYFNDQRDGAFQTPLQELLGKGIHFKCFVLDPNGNFARKYFEDRARIQSFEKEALSASPAIIKDLKMQFVQLNREGHPGQIELYTYDHFPYFHATVIDGNTEQGQMIISPYLYGVTRANTPVIELDRKRNKILFKRYWASVRTLTENQIQQIV